MKNDLTPQERAYSNIVTFLEGLLDFHPEFFQGKEGYDTVVLSQYYFWGRLIDADDIFVYREQLVSKDHEIVTRAEHALNTFLTDHQIDAKADDYDAWLKA